MISYTGDYIEHFIKAIGESAKQSADSLVRYEYTTVRDEGLLINKGKISRSTSIVFGYFKRFPITNTSYAAEGIGLSFKSTIKVIDLL